MIDNNSPKTNSIAEGFFYGAVDSEQVFPFPSFTQEQKESAKEIVDAVSKYIEDHIDSRKMDETAEIPPEALKGLAELGLCGLVVPEEFGGMELDASLYGRVFAEVCSHDASLAVTLGSHQSIGYRALLLEGTLEQKQKWLPSLASGEKMAAFCLTEPSSGSDAYSIKTKAVKNSDGTFTINGQKLWISNARLASFYTVFCKTDHHIDGKDVEKISAFIVEKERPGLSFGEKEDKMGIRASETRTVYFDNVTVPPENVIGQLGKGFKIAMNVLNTGRLSIGSGCVGGMRKIIEMATNHAKNRKQFGKSIIEFGIIQDKLAEMASMTYAAESAVYMTSGSVVKGMKNFHLETAICKIYSSESLWQVVDLGLQIAAGNGYMKEYPYERMMRDSRINLIFEGTNEILRCFLALSGMRGPSEDLKELGKIANVSKALENPIKSLGILTDFAKGRLSKMVPTLRLSGVHPELREWGNTFSSFLGAFAIQVENTLIKYGKDIVEHELPQKRLADMLIQLYVTLSVLSRTTTILEDKNIDEEKKEYCLQLARLALSRSRYLFIANYKQMNKNQDQTIQSVSEKMSSYGGYGLDIVDF